MSSRLAVALALALAGCGRAPEEPPAERVTLTVYVPCVLSGALQGVISAYQEMHRGTEVVTQVDKPQAVLARAQEVQQGPAAVITMGEVEMAVLVKGGVVAAEEMHAFAVNTYPLAVVVPAEAGDDVRQLTDLAGPRVERVYLEDPHRSTSAQRARQALEKLGLWEDVSGKVVRPAPDAMVLAELLAGKADAAIVFEDCLLGETAEGKPPSTISIVGELPEETHSPIMYYAAALRSAPNAPTARQFVGFLTSYQGKQALRRAGLTPVD